MITQTASKRARLRKLARQRQRESWRGYGRVSDYCGGAYECDEVSPYTKGAGNVDSPVFVLLQDWASEKMLDRTFDQELAQLGHMPRLATNKNLKTVLEETFSLDLDEVYATNLFPFIKPGGASDPIAMVDLLRAAKEFALPQIRIVQPALVICLGKRTFNAMRRACGYKPLPTLALAIKSPFEFEGAIFWCQAHTGAFGLMTRSGVAGALRDWHLMKRNLQRRGLPVDRWR